MYTFAPFCANPMAIILPIPEPPPVTRTVFDAEEVALQSPRHMEITTVRTNFAGNFEERLETKIWNGIFQN